MIIPDFEIGKLWAKTELGFWRIVIIKIWHHVLLIKMTFNAVVQKKCKNSFCSLWRHFISQSWELLNILFNINDWYTIGNNLFQIYFIICLVVKKTPSIFAAPNTGKTFSTTSENGAVKSEKRFGIMEIIHLSLHPLFTEKVL